MTMINGHEIHMPDAHTFADVFEEARPWVFDRVGAPQPEPIAPRLIHGTDWIEPIFSSRAPRPGMASTEVGPFCTVRNGKSLAVSATDAAMKAIESRAMMINGDRMSFTITKWSDGTALVTCDYGRILGTIWLARIDASTIPFQE